ncbi:nucleoside/nucleotide kinase family protein [Micropruina sonneratiae]|uniref:nucleoside/nucleotide kinase family protein n=1 Tax=Micropruina sonneratiae TaxID=2986940 RepID=UPI002227251A|nr:nucleoside/nucleotide kinase family protein [Micropruina sp. KQZ13P-5]MCW3158462.1 nucleoside/nucleotide kinase family protein [Micropruina sp. KQZ13P-5]
MLLTEAVEVAAALAGRGDRTLLGLVGPPGVGKSTLSAVLADRLGPAMVVVGMDGFHLANAELLRLGRRDRKGAPDTFDVDGYVALLGRLRRQTAPLYAPRFDRDLEESIGSAVPVEPGVPLVVTEGNYLLHDEGGWDAVRPLLDEVWYLDLDDAERRRRLVHRRLGHGDTLEHAQHWAHTVDEVNAELVRAARSRADRVVAMP